MKKMFLFLIAISSFWMVQAQSITVKVRGDRNFQVQVDGQSYAVNRDAGSATGVNLPIIIQNLGPGQHSLQVIRRNPVNSRSKAGMITHFTTRQGFDMNITVNGNGSIQLSETSSATSGNNPGHIGSAGKVMSHADFQALYKDVQGQWPSSTRMAYISTHVFGPATNIFTLIQARQMITVMSSESERLQLAKEAYDNLVNPGSYTGFYDVLASETSRDELASYINSVAPGITRSPMTATRFNQLYLDVRQQWSYSEKINLIHEVFSKSDNHFTTTQAKSLIDLASSDPDRLDLAKSAWDNITDPANYSQLYELFSSTTVKNDFTAFLRSGGISAGTSPAMTAMADATFNSLYGRISNQWGLGVKMASLTELFDDASNHFSVAQAKKLITLVSAEYNRLALAKSSYDNIADKNNFNQLYDIFESPANRIELDAYVNSYSYNL